MVECCFPSGGRSWLPMPAPRDAGLPSGEEKNWSRGMSQDLEPLILDLLEWIGPQGRPYAEVLDAWRTSCPRLPVWEEAHDRGFLSRQIDPVRGPWITVSPEGAQHLNA